MVSRKFRDLAYAIAITGLLLSYWWGLGFVTVFSAGAFMSLVLIIDGNQFHDGLGPEALALLFAWPIMGLATIICDYRHIRLANQKVVKAATCVRRRAVLRHRRGLRGMRHR